MIATKSKGPVAAGPERWMECDYGGEADMGGATGQAPVKHWADYPLGYLKRVTDSPSQVTTLRRVVEEVRSSKHKAAIDAMRLAFDMEVASGDSFARGKLNCRKREQLPAVQLGGLFRDRTGVSLIRHSGLFQIDLDDLPSGQEGRNGLKEKLRQAHHVAAYFDSPSGEGLKVIVRGPVCSGKNEVRRAFDAASIWFQKLTGLSPDAKVGDIGHPCYLSHDPEAYFNEKAEELPVAPSELVELIQTDRQGIEPAPAASEKRVNEALNFIEAEDYSEWLAVGMALHNWDPLRGLPLWIDWSRTAQNKFKVGEPEAKWAGFTRGGGRTISTLFGMAKARGFEAPATTTIPSTPPLMTRTETHSPLIGGYSIDAKPVSASPLVISPRDFRCIESWGCWEDPIGRAAGEFADQPTAPAGLPPVQQSTGSDEPVAGGRLPDFDFTAESEVPSTVLSFLGKPIASRGNVTYVQAPPKVGKSAVCGAIVAAVWVARETIPAIDTLGFTATNTTGKVLLADLEHSDDDLRACGERIFKRLGVPPQMPDWLSVKTPPASRDSCAKLEAECATGLYDLVIIDGLGRLLGKSSNDSEASYEVVQWLEGLSKRYRVASSRSTHPKATRIGGMEPVGAISAPAWNNTAGPSWSSPREPVASVRSRLARTAAGAVEATA